MFLKGLSVLFIPTEADRPHLLRGPESLDPGGVLPHLEETARLELADISEEAGFSPWRSEAEKTGEAPSIQLRGDLWMLENRSFLRPEQKKLGCRVVEEGAIAHGVPSADHPSVSRIVEDEGKGTQETAKAVRAVPMVGGEHKLGIGDRALQRPFGLAQELLPIVQSAVEGNRDGSGRIRERLSPSDFLGHGDEVLNSETHGVLDRDLEAVGTPVAEGSRHLPQHALLHRTAISSEDGGDAGHGDLPF
jgi:hypothetical protein